MYNKKLFAYSLLLPSMILSLLIVMYPFFNGIWISFQKKQLVMGTSSFVGLKNFIILFHRSEYWNAFRNTVIWTLGSVVFQHLIALPIALLLNQKIKFRFLFRGLFIIPWICPVVVFALLWQWLYNDLYGLINWLLKEMNFINEPILWLGTRDTAMLSAIFANTWRGFAIPMITMLAGLQMIPQELYEAAEMDGASRWYKFLHITLPFLKGPIMVTSLLVSIWTFNNFGTMFLLTRGGPVDATKTLAIMAYETSFINLKMGRGAAVTVTMMIVLLTLSAIYIYRRKHEEI